MTPYNAYSGYVNSALFGPPGWGGWFPFWFPGGGYVGYPSFGCLPALPDCFVPCGRPGNKENHPAGPEGEGKGNDEKPESEPTGCKPEPDCGHPPENGSPSEEGGCCPSPCEGG